MKLRPIQTEALNATIESMKAGGLYHLMVASVSFGKTIYSSHLMQYALETHGAKCLFLAHLGELVQQTYDKFMKVAPHLETKTGIFAAGLAQKDVADITIGSRQSVARALKDFPAINLLIIDECHLMGDDGEWDRIINHFKALNPRLRVVGLTGTPYRMKTGYIYGDGKRWPKPCFEARMKDMTDQGYLCPIRYKMVVQDRLKSDLKGVNMVAGEYNNSQLGNVMSEKVHMQSVQHALEKYAVDRKSIIVFATNIAHAEALAEMLGCKAVHSRLPKKEWREAVDRLKAGYDRVIVNVGQMTIGFDAPNVDCAIIARPTKSPALYVQIVGRVVRINSDKEDALILDLVGNYEEHGSPYEPIVTVAGNKKKEPEFNICPDCFELAEPNEEYCPYCGAPMKEQIERRAKKKQYERRQLELKDIELNSKKVVKKWVKPNHRTKKGFMGTLYCIKIQGREMPLFKFETRGAKGKVKEMFDQIVVGERYLIEKTKFGEWISKTQVNTLNRSQ